MNDFQTDLAWSHSCDEADCWKQIYKTAFPTMRAMVNHRENGDHQRAGIDRSIILDNSKQILVDEKARRIQDTGDIMIEYVSNDRIASPGWAEKPLLSDYIAYAFMPSGTAYLLPVIQLQSAWLKHKADWLKQFGTKPAKNPDYRTLNCPVPTNTLYSAIGGMLRVTFKKTVPA